MANRIGLVLEGGGMRGIYTAGVLDVFMEEEITVDGVIGVSAGALHGSSYMSHQPYRNLRYYKKYCSGPRMMSYWNLIFTGNIANVRFCYHTLPDRLDPYDYEEFERSSMEFYVTCSNVETGRAEYIRIRHIREEVDAVRASASLPFLSRIVPYRGMKLLDGGYTDSIPVQAFAELGFRKNIVVLTQHEGYVKQPEHVERARKKYRRYPQFAEAIATRHIRYNKTLEEIRRMEREGSAFVIRPSRKLEIGHLVRDPDELQKVYDIGYQDARARIGDLGQWMKTAAKQEI